MSHSVIINISHLNFILKLCDDSIAELQGLLKYNWNKEVLEKIYLLENQLKEIRKETENLVGHSLENLDINSLLSSILKKISNLKLSLNIKEIYSEYSRNDFSLDSYIIEYGIIAKEAFAILIKEKKEINQKNFLYQIDKLQNKNIEKENLKKLQNAFIKEIKDSGFSDDISISLINLISKYEKFQEINDIPAFIRSKKEEYNLMKSYMKDTISILKELGFKTSDIIKFKFNDDQLFESTIKFINKSNNSVLIKFNSNNQIKYKLGNYVGHACEKTTKFLLEKLKRKGYSYSEPIIRREISDSVPLAKKAKEVGK